MSTLSFKPKFMKPDYDGLDTKTNDDQVTSFVFNAHHSLPLSDQRERLPIRKYRDQILYCLEEYQVLILIGETGCGKSTQIPQYLYEWGWHLKGVIGVTEPWRLAAITLADRVATERGELMGDTVGLMIRFNERYSGSTKIKYMTEEILLRELLKDPLLTQYGVIMIDEAHERKVLTDTVLGFLKKVTRKRPSLKIIISSATIDAEFFKDFFSIKNKKTDKQTSVILSVEGRMHPVSIYYLSKPCANYVRETVTTVWKIHKKEPTGDILAFLTDQEEVLEACDLLKEYILTENEENMQVFPMYGTLSSAEQLKAFFTPPKGVRKVVIATSIAETSITIPGITYVIDCGLMKLKWFNSTLTADNNMSAPISKGTAVQRAGRAGRMRPGKVYRLYTEEDFGKLPERIPSEMRRSELSSTVLHLKALGISNILRFDFPSAPPAKHLLCALERLYALEAIDETGNLNKPVLGYFMCEMPLDPMLSKMLYISGQMGCSDEIITIIAMLQVQSVYSKPVTAQAQAKGRVAKRNFEVAEGDLITLLNVYTAFIENDRSKEFCGQYYLIYRNMKYALELRQQLLMLATKKFNIPLKSCNGDVELLCKCITGGLFLNTAYLHHSGVYRKIHGTTELCVHPQSALYTLRQPQFVVYCELFENNNKMFMKNLTVIKEEWLTELAPHYYYKTTVKD